MDYCALQISMLLHVKVTFLNNSKVNSIKENRVYRPI